MSRFRILAALFVLSASISAIDGPILALDPEELGLTFGWTIRNGHGELGEVGKPAPGYNLIAFFQPAVYAALPERDCFPITKAEEDGNRYVLVPGHRGLAEYSLSLAPYLLDREGEMEFSFRARWTAGEDGSFHDGTRVSLDYRCRNLDLQHGSVSERYPVLESRGFRPTTEWQDFKFTIKVKKGFRYLTWFRVSGRKPEEGLNGFCVDDIRLATGEKVAAWRGECSLALANRASALFHGQKASFSAVAILPGSSESAEVRLHIQRDWENDAVKVPVLKLTRDKSYRGEAGRSRYLGRVEVAAERYGSFHMKATVGEDPISLLGGDFTVLHPLPAGFSPIQRRLGSHYRTHGSTWGSLPDNGPAVAAQNGLGGASFARDLALTGLGHAMYSFDLKKVQPEPRRMDFTLPDMEIAQLEKTGMEPVGCLGGWWIYTERSKRGDALVGSLPDWFYDDSFTHAITGAGDRKIARSLKEDIWRFHVEEIVARYGKRIRTWMVQVEPQWVLSAEEYVKLQKIAWEIVKKNDPKAYFIAGDATSDNGYNLTGWLEKLHALGFEKYLDAASFNPYGSSLDFIGGERFRYSGLIERIRKILAPGTALWEQELYYIANSKRPWRLAEQDVFSAGDVQRHYLLGLLHGLRGVTAIDPGAHYKALGGMNRPDTTVLGDVGAGLNALSFFLAGKKEVERVAVPNQLLHAGLFLPIDGASASAAVWALSPKGMGLRLAEASGISFFDRYGNPFTPGPVLDLGLDPVFLTGAPAALRAMLTKSAVILAEPVAIRARAFKDRTWLEALNLTGSRNVIAVQGDELPPLRVAFFDSETKGFALDRRLTKSGFLASLEGDANQQAGTIKTLPDGGQYVLPEIDGLPLSAGSEAPLRLWVEGGMLRIQARVKDAQITAAPDENVWNGDALEVFIDRTPFTRLEVDLFNGKNIPGLSVLQYMFAVKPTKTGAIRAVKDNASGKDVPGCRAEAKAIPVAGGWGLDLSIPLSEAAPLPGNGGIVALNVEVTRRDGEKMLPKFRLFGTAAQESWKQRLHYALFQMPVAPKNLVANGGAEDGLSKWDCNVKADLSLTDQAWGGKSAIRVALNEQPAWGPTLQAGRVSVAAPLFAPGRYLVRLMARASKLTEFKVVIPGAAPRSFQGAQLPASERWTAYEAAFTVKEPKNYGRVGVEFLTTRGAPDSWGMVDDVELYRLDEGGAP
jgi:hypothetical protein